MAGWVIERRLRDGRVAYDIGYRVAGRLVKRKGGSTQGEAEAALTVALAEIATGATRPQHGHARQLRRALVPPRWRRGSRPDARRAVHPEDRDRRRHRPERTRWPCRLAASRSPCSRQTL